MYDKSMLRKGFGPYPGGRCTMAENTPGDDSAVMGTVSTHRVKDPQRCT